MSESGETKLLKNTPQYNGIYHGKKALLGDYTLLCENTRQTLLLLGFQVDVVEQGTQIVERIKNANYDYDVIFTNNTYNDSKDINGRCIDGIAVLNLLKQELHVKIPIVVVTISNLSESQFAFYGFDGCIKKPAAVENTKMVLDRLFEHEQINKA